MNASKLNGVTLKTDTMPVVTREGKMNVPDIQTVIKDYGIVTEWNTTRGGRYSLMSRPRDTCSVKVALLYPSNGPKANDNREVRQELYLQAESIVEVMKLAGFQFISPPRIVLGGVEGQIEGTIEIDVMF
jgi:hypothetical protein